MPNPGYRSTPLTDEDIIEMRELRANQRKSVKWLGWKFDTTPANAHLIVTGRTHKNVGGPITPVKGPTSDEEVVEIRTMRAMGYTYAELAKEYGKSEVALRSICSGKSFPHLPGPRSGEVGRHKSPGRPRGRKYL